MELTVSTLGSLIICQGRLMENIRYVQFYKFKNLVFQNWRGVIAALTDLKDHVAYYSNMSANEELHGKK
jgi:hypothetical protein